jgi:hypothetical protein
MHTNFWSENLNHLEGIIRCTYGRDEKYITKFWSVNLNHLEGILRYLDEKYVQNFSLKPYTTWKN